MEEKSGRFTYTYSAPTEKERYEIESIRSRYVSDKSVTIGLTQLKQLDKKTYSLPMAIGLLLGILGALVFAFGIIMIALWDILGGGVAVSLVGLVISVSAFPVFGVILRRQKIKYSHEILELSEALLNRDGVREPGEEPPENKDQINTKL